MFELTVRRLVRNWLGEAMTEPILDFHTHAQNVFGMCCVRPALRPFFRRGLVWAYEKSGFDPRLKRAETPLTRGLIVRELQSRFATFSFDDYLSALHRNGVTHACALPVEPMAKTAELLSLSRETPTVIPFASVDFESREDVTQQLGRHLAAGCKGVKLHPIMQNVAPEDERIVAIFEMLAHRGIPVLFHTGRMHYFVGQRPEDASFAEPPRLVPLLRRFPHQPVVFGHMGLLDAAPATAIAKEYPNVYLETSFQPLSVITRALREVGLNASCWVATGQQVSRQQKLPSYAKRFMVIVLLNERSFLKTVPICYKTSV